MQMKANNYKQTISQIPNEWGVTVPENIGELDAKFYHILLVTRQHIPEQETYNTTARVVKYDVDFWNRKKHSAKDYLSSLGHKRQFILHDPTNKIVVEEKVIEKKPAGRPKKNNTED